MNIDEKINSLANNLGMENVEKTILKMIDDENQNKKVLELQSGNFENIKPWFVIDEKNEQVYPLVPIELFLSLLNATRSAFQENLNIRLEKAITYENPIDYNDVYTVAMDEVEKIINSPKDKNLLNLNVDNLVKKIKKRYPNLFHKNIKHVEFKEESYD